MDTQQWTRADFVRLEAKLDAVDQKLDELRERQRWQKELVDEMSPILREAMTVASERLHEMDQAGYFTFGREAVRVVERVAETYSEEDVRLLGDHIVGIMDTIKNVTQPAVLSVANDATAVLNQPEELEPMGVVGMVKASQDDDVKKGTAIMFEILRQIGRTATARAASPPEERGERGAEPPARLRATTSPPRGAAGANGSNGHAAASRAPRQGGGQDGWELCSQGHLANPEEWSETFAEAMASALGVGTLSPEQWAVVRSAREEWKTAGAAPNVRRLGACASVPTKQLYKLFPKAPARTVAKIAGIPKPAGCI